nr:hypothetical protein GCM10017745_03980 [Saccharothrix mutabilis subsp. capreolus]
MLKLLGLCLLAGVLLAGMMFPVVGSLGLVSNRASDTVDSISADLVTTDPPLITTITDKDGAPIAYLYDQYRVLVPPEKISPTMKAALVSVEDRRFYEHQGVDWRGTIRAGLTNQVSGAVTQGASTLTQQYVKNYLVHVVARNNQVEAQKAQEQTIARKARKRAFPCNWNANWARRKSSPATSTSYRSVQRSTASPRRPRRTSTPRPTR